MAPPWAEGDTVVVRSVFQGHIRMAIPFRLVELRRERLVTYLPPGTRLKRFAGRPLHQVADLATNDWSLVDAVWSHTRCLRLTRFGEAHSLALFWDADSNDFLGWYLDLQAPLRPSALGWDTRDYALDVWIEPDGRWRWKDEDHFAAAAARGLFADPGAIRAEGERLLAEWPFPTGWEEWRPDPEWPLPELPARWDVS